MGSSILSVKEALSDIEAGNTQILVADKEYYKQHKETFKSWKVLKTSHRFQNEHRFLCKKMESCRRFILKE